MDLTDGWYSRNLRIISTIQGICVAILLLLGAFVFLPMMTDSPDPFNVRNGTTANRGAADAADTLCSSPPGETAEMLWGEGGHAGMAAGWLSLLCIINEGPEGMRSGTITGIEDGDTLSIDGMAVRLVLVDAPERDEDGAGDATGFVMSACPVGTEALYDVDDLQVADAYGRVLAVVWCLDGQGPLNDMLVESGHGTAYTRFCDASEFRQAEWLDGACDTEPGQ